jgi:hypothetical protein
MRVLRFRRRFGMWAVATVGAALGSMLPATAASAAEPGPLYLSAETNFDSQVYKSVRVFCPSGMQVIGGSYDLVGAEGAVVLDDFIPEENNLLVGAGEIVGPGEAANGTTASWKVVATVVCSNPVPGYSIQPATSDFTHTTGQAGRATCPPGRVVISGGASLSNGFGQVSIALLDVGTGIVEADGITDVDGYSGNWSVTAYAICGNPLPGWREVHNSSSSEASLSRTKTAFCLPGQAVISVSWRTLGAIIGVVDRYFARAAIVSTDTDPGVTATAIGPASTRNPWSVESRAVCVDRGAVSH